MKKMMSILLMLLMSISVFADFHADDEYVYFNEPCDIRVIDYYEDAWKAETYTTTISGIGSLWSQGYYLDKVIGETVYLKYICITNDITIPVTPSVDVNNNFVWTTIVVKQQYEDIGTRKLKCKRKVLFKPINSDIWIDDNGISQEDFITDIKYREFIQGMRLVQEYPNDLEKIGIIVKYIQNEYLTIDHISITNQINVVVTNTIYETVTTTNFINVTSYQTNIIERNIMNISNILNIVNCYVTNYTDEVTFTTNVVQTFLTNYVDQISYVTNIVSEIQTNIVSISSIEHMQDSDVGKSQNELELQPGLTTAARKTSSLIYNGDYCAGIVYLNIYKSSSASKVKVDGKIAFSNGKVYSITSGYGKIVNGILSAKLKSGLGQCAINVGTNGIMGVIGGKYDVLPIIPNKNMGTLNGNLNFRYFDKSKGLVSRTMKIKGVAVNDEHLLIISDGTNAPYKVYGERVK